MKTTLTLKNNRSTQLHRKSNIKEVPCCKYYIREDV